MDKMPSIKRRDLPPASLEHIEILKLVYPATITSGAAAIRYALLVAVAEAEKSNPEQVRTAKKQVKKATK